MSNLFQTLFTTIASGSTVSSTVALKSAKLAAFWSPVVDSCYLQMQASWNTTSANFSDLYEADGSGVQKWYIGAGAVAMTLGDATPAPYLRLETSVAQTDTRTFTIGVKL